MSGLRLLDPIVSKSHGISAIGVCKIVTLFRFISLFAFLHIYKPLQLSFFFFFRDKLLIYKKKNGGNCEMLMC